MDWCIRKRRPPPPEGPGRSRRTVVKLGKSRRIELEESFDSWMAAIRIDSD